MIRSTAKRTTSAFLFSALLLTTISTSAENPGTGSGNNASKALPITMPKTKKQWLSATGLGLFLWGLTRLKSKGTKKHNYTWSTSEFTQDFVEAIQIWKALSDEQRMTFFGFLDKYIVGREFSLVGIKTKRQLEDGSWESITDKIPKSKPFGVIGCIDAYCFYFLEKFSEHFDNLGKMLEHCNTNIGLN